MWFIIVKFFLKGGWVELFMLFVDIVFSVLCEIKCLLICYFFFEGFVSIDLSIEYFFMGFLVIVIFIGIEDFFDNVCRVYFVIEEYSLM